MMEKIHIALAFDDNYINHGMVLMTSILVNKNNDDQIHFHILDGGFSDETKKQLLDFKNCAISFHNVDDKIFKGYIKSDYYPESMLWTMLLPEIIQVDKLIYLDCDIVVNSSLKELWEIDLENNYVAAVEDANGKKYVKRFGLKPDSKFFNSGMMLLNSKKCRQDNISKRAIEISMAHNGTRFGYDQTVLNQLFEGNVKYLDLKWNLQYCPFNVWATYDDKEEYKNAIKTPAIIHYVGDFKPWKRGLGCFNPKQDDYLQYHKLTPYAFSNYKKWKIQDKMSFYRGVWAFVKRYPFFFLRSQFWKNLTTDFYS